MIILDKNFSTKAKPKPTHGALLGDPRIKKVIYMCYASSLWKDVIFSLSLLYFGTPLRRRIQGCNRYHRLNLSIKLVGSILSFIPIKFMAYTNTNIQLEQAL